MLAASLISGSALASDYLLRDLGAIVPGSDPVAVRPVRISNTMLVVGNTESGGGSLPWVWLPHSRWLIPDPSPLAGDQDREPCDPVGFSLNLTVLAGLPTAYSGVARDVNDAGFVVGGHVIDERGVYYPFAWQLNDFTPSTGTVDAQSFPIDDYVSGIAYGLNEEVVPEIVGAYDAGCPGAIDADGFRTRWGFSTTTPLDLPDPYSIAVPVEITTPPPFPDPQIRWAGGIAKLTCLTGQCDPGTDPAIWRIDQSSLSTLPEPFSQTQSGVHHMNESLDTVGWVANVGGSPLVCLRRAAVWLGDTSSSQPVDLHAILPGGPLESEAFGIANRQVGLIELVGGDTQNLSPFRWLRTGLSWTAVNLNLVTELGGTCATYDITLARDVNDCGWIVAEADRSFEGSIERRAVVLRPIVDCPSDLDRDGTVGPPDLAILLGLWGADLSCDSFIADLDYDFNLIGAADMAVLLGAWGGCPLALDEGAFVNVETAASVLGVPSATSWCNTMDAAAVAAGFLSFEDFKTAVTTLLSIEDAEAACVLFAAYAGGGM
jgi:hypothetical protein